MKKQHLTIHDLARELNISASTVSRALQDNPRISVATRKAVQEMARKYNYQPNVVASSLRRGKSHMVGVVVPRINRNFFSMVIGGLEEVLAGAGYQLIICQSHEQIKDEARAIDTLVHARVDAIILSVSMETHSQEHLEKVREKGIGLYLFDRVIKGLHVPSVSIDDRLGAYLSVKHLLEQGCRRIFHLAGPDHISIYRNRKEGYLQALKEHGISPAENWIMEDELVQEGGERVIQKALEQDLKPDAFFCAGDYAALGMLKAAREAGMSVPGDVAISGFANEPFTSHLHPSLTTVDQKAEEMGRKMAELFLRRQQGEEAGPVVIAPELIIRNSTTKIK